MNSSDLVVLSGGLTVPREALDLLLHLETRGISLRLAEGDGLMARPSSKLTDLDRVAIKRWRQDIRALLAYEAATPAWLQ